MKEIIVRFPQPIALIFLLLGLPVFIFMALVSVWMTFSLHTLMGKFPMLGIAACYFIFPIMVIVSIASIFFCVRYGKETLFTTFFITEQGIKIENRRYGLLVLSWDDIKVASYNRFLKIVVLHSPKLEVPIAISNWKNFPEAVLKIKQNIGTRWVTKWI